MSYVYVDDFFGLYPVAIGTTQFNANTTLARNYWDRRMFVRWLLSDCVRDCRLHFRISNQYSINLAEVWLESFFRGCDLSFTYRLENLFILDVDKVHFFRLSVLWNCIPSASVWNDQSPAEVSRDRDRCWPYHLCPVVYSIEQCDSETERIHAGGIRKLLTIFDIILIIAIQVPLSMSTTNCSIIGESGTLILTLSSYAGISNKTFSMMIDVVVHGPPLLVSRKPRTHIKQVSQEVGHSK